MSAERLAPEQYDTIPGVPEPAEHTALIGHDLAAQALAQAYRSGRLHHALLFAGPAGIGKATLAFRLAHHLLAYPDAEAAPDRLAPIDPASSLHRLIAQGAHPGVLHLTRPVNERTKSFKSAVTVDEVRRVNRFLSMTSHDGGYRVVIVDPADDMNPNAANALLKNLEEPPSRTLFILIAHRPGRLLPTIRSRCRTVRLEPLSAAELIAVLEALPPGLTEDAKARDAIVVQADGSVREALLLTQFGGLDIADAIAGIVTAPAFNVAAAIKVADAMAGRDREVQFQIFNRSLLDTIASLAARAAGRGDLHGAARLSALWTDFREATRQTETYNLDRKQHVGSMLRRAHEGVSAV